MLNFMNYFEINWTCFPPLLRNITHHWGSKQNQYDATYQFQVHFENIKEWYYTPRNPTSSQVATSVVFPLQSFNLDMDPFFIPLNESDRILNFIFFSLVMYTSLRQSIMNSLLFVFMNIKMYKNPKSNPIPFCPKSNPILFCNLSD